MVTLEPAREVVPGAGDEGVFAGEVLDHGFMSRLHEIISGALASASQNV